MSDQYTSMMHALSGGLFDTPDKIRADLAEARCKELERRNAELLDYFHQKRRTTCSNHAAFITRNTSH